jgi:hypothetical protein
LQTLEISQRKYREEEDGGAEGPWKGSEQHYIYSREAGINYYCSESLQALPLAFIELRWRQGKSCGK